MGLVRYEREGAVAIVRIDRPEVRNCVDRSTAEELAAAFRRFESEEGAAVAVLAGMGDCFCAGADLKAVGEGRGNRLGPEGDGPMGPSRMLLDKPVLAAVEGYAVAGGLELALWCDMRIAASDAVFGVFCRRWGVPLVDGGSIRLTRLIGQSHAMDLILTGRGVCGEEARMMGLANRLVAPGQALEEAVALAETLARFPQRCLRGDRLSAYRQWSLSLEDALAEETRIGQQVIDSGETSAGARRFKDGAGRHGVFE